MAETGEGNPATNFQKTVGAQNERVEAVKEPSGFFRFHDTLTGRHATGFVQSEYKSGEGGSVQTSIDSGRASLYQTWRFDKDGNLIGMRLSKQLRPNSSLIGGKSEDAGVLQLVKGEDGKFQINKSQSNFYTPEWAKEFHTAKTRMARNKPAAVPQPPQK